VGTVKKHIEALKKEAPDVLSTYCELGLQTIHVALAKGRIDENKADELRAALKAGFKRRVRTEHEEIIGERSASGRSRDDALPVL
jgi:hypothetical protein